MTTSQKIAFIKANKSLSTQTAELTNSKINAIKDESLMDSILAEMQEAGASEQAPIVSMPSAFEAIEIDTKNGSASVNIVRASFVRAKVKTINATKETFVTFSFKFGSAYITTTSEALKLAYKFGKLNAGDEFLFKADTLKEYRTADGTLIYQGQILEASSALMQKAREIKESTDLKLSLASPETRAILAQEEAKELAGSLKIKASDWD